MANINEILQRAASLRDETALNSISPERAGSIMYDTLIALNELWLQQGSALVISKIYASVSAMEADTAPVSDLTGQPLRPGQIVVIASSDSDNGTVYRYNGTTSPSWTSVGKIGNLEPVDSLDSDSASLPLAAHQGKVLDGKISQLGQYVTNAEWVKVVTDKDGKILYGVDKDGHFCFGEDCPSQIKDYVISNIKTYGYNKNTIDSLLSNKVDTVSGESLIDADFASGISYKNDTEFVDVKTDNDGRLLEGTKQDGTKEFLGDIKIDGDIDTEGAQISVVDSDQWIEIKTDSKGQILEGTRKNGEKYFYGIKKIYNKFDEIDNPYNQILISERNDLLKRWIPYYKGAIKETFDTGEEYNRCNLLFFTDSHIDEPGTRVAPSTENLKDTIEFINNCPVQIDAVLQGGDNITPFDRVSHSYAMEWAKNYYSELKKSKFPVCFIRGNHDNNDWNNYPSEVITNEDYNNLWYDFAEKRFHIVRNPNEVNVKVVDGSPVTSSVKSMYHYFDIPTQKIRIISVDVEDIDRVTTNDDGWCKFYGTTMNYVAQRQFNWIANTALKNLDEGWGVVFLMHQSVWLWPSFHDENPHLTWFGSRGDGVHTIEPGIPSSIEKLFRLAFAFNTQSTYSESYNYAGEQYDNYYDLNINADYTDYASMTNKPHVICWLMGHEHQDFNTRLNISNGDIVVDENNGINFIWTAQAAAWMGASDDRLVKIPGTPNQNCFDILSIDTTHRKIRTFRYGAGKNCFGVGGDRFLTNGIDY